jgi:hypothetical protein
MAKTVALGTVLKMENPATVGYLTIGNLTSLSVPGPQRDEIEVTDFDSVAKEFLAGLPDNGEISFSGFYNEASSGQDALYEDANDPDAPDREFIIEFTRQNIKFTFDGWVKSFVPNAGGPQEAYTFDGSIRVTGAVVKAPIST